ncbi:hypothetical protein BKA81DRAFT_368965 [Phyllosticta paracitricarpa]
MFFVDCCQSELRHHSPTPPTNTRSEPRPQFSTTTLFLRLLLHLAAAGRVRSALFHNSSSTVSTGFHARRPSAISATFHQHARIPSGSVVLLTASRCSALTASALLLLRFQKPCLSRPVNLGSLSVLVFRLFGFAITSRSRTATACAKESRDRPPERPSSSHRAPR